MSERAIKTYRIAAIPGDGIGKEVIPAGQKVLQALACGRAFEFDFETFDWGAEFYLQHGGGPARLTASSDAAINSPGTLFQQIRECVVEGGFRLETVLPMVTSNTARVLKLTGKGRLIEGADADVLVVGSELVSTEPQVEQWTKTIAEVRKTFTGYLTYLDFVEAVITVILQIAVVLLLANLLYTINFRPSK